MLRPSFNGQYVMNVMMGELALQRGSVQRGTADVFTATYPPAPGCLGHSAFKLAQRIHEQLLPGLPRGQDAWPSTMGGMGTPEAVAAAHATAPLKRAMPPPNRPVASWL